MSLVEKLNKYEVSYKLTKEGVELESCPSDDSLFDSEGVVVDKDFETFLDELDEYKSWVEENPVNSDCGLVVVVEYKDEAAWYYEGECEWQEFIS